MAKMLPAHCDPSTLSAAERRIFDLLKTDPGTSDWIVLHSLGLSHRGRKPYGEIDFVALVPGAGVLCLEIKGGRIACTDGEWETTNRYGRIDKLKRSPFLQAREGMFAIRDSVQRRSPSGFPSGLLFAYAVILPDIIFNAVSPEWARWQVIDRETLKHPIGEALLRLASEQAKLHGGISKKEPSFATLKILQQMLRPDFELVVTYGSRIEDTELQLLHLTEEQYDLIDVLTDNKRCFFEGPAGTGKTMLAIEYSVRSAQSEKRTLCTCYNRLLGDWFERCAARSSTPPHLVAGSFYKLLRNVILQSSFESEFRQQEKSSAASELYDNIYPFYGVLAIEEHSDLYDVLVIDEAQDLLRPGILEVMNAWLKGGLAEGQWVIFGDFLRQAIFSSVTGEELKALVHSKSSQFAKGRLTLNCRNTRNIGEETALLSGFASPPYRMGQVAGLPVDYRYYDSPDDQRSTLSDTLRKLLAGGVKASDIVVVSHLRLSNSAIVGLNGGNDFKIVDIGDIASTRSRVPVIYFSTTQAFKGMESPVVVLCDVEHVSEHETQALLYVAMSRARSHLVVIAHSNVRDAINQLFRRRLLEEWSKNP